MRVLTIPTSISVKVFFILLIIATFAHSKPLIVNKELLSSDTYSKSTQFYINEVVIKLAKDLAHHSLVSLNSMNLFVSKITDGENMKRNNKFSIIMEDNIKHMLQVNHKVNVFNLEKMSLKSYKRLVKKMGISHILIGVFHKFRDGVSLNIEIMTLKESKIVASASTSIKQSLYQRVINMDYVGEDTNDDYFMQLKGSK